MCRHVHMSACDWVGVRGLCWHMVPSHVCFYVGFLTPSLAADGTVSQHSAQQAHWHKPLATWTHKHTQESKWTYPHTCKLAYVWCACFQICTNSLVHEINAHAMISRLPSVNYFHKLCHVESDNTHWQVSLPQGRSPTVRWGQLARAPDWELTQEVLSWLIRYQHKPRKTLSGHVMASLNICECVSVSVWATWCFFYQWCIKSNISKVD